MRLLAMGAVFDEANSPLAEKRLTAAVRAQHAFIDLHEMQMVERVALMLNQKVDGYPCQHNL
jgi:hypothetical protein